MARIVHFYFFDFDLYIDNFDILFSYSNKQDRPSIFASHVASRYKTDHRLVILCESVQNDKVLHIQNRGKI